MIALTRESRILDASGEPIRLPVKRQSAIKARYDAAQDSPDYRRIWENADYYDADSSNRREVRHKLMSRARYEVANNGYLDGILQTHCNYSTGTGPQLRMETQSADFNEQVERRFRAWARSIQLRRKLWAMNHAKVQDGEAFAIMRNNPRIEGPVQLDIKLIEAEQVQSIWRQEFFEPGVIDGIEFDEFDNPIAYDVLLTHPGSNNMLNANLETLRIPADFMLHFYKLRRPGEHRAVPEFRSTLNVGAASRRWREVTLGAAETAAEYTAVMKTSLTPDADDWDALDEIPFEKRMLTALPMGWDVTQMKAEHPNATFKDFARQQINEQGRPKSVPVNVGMADSSDHNFASGKLDHQSWFAEITVERQDAQDLVLDRLFALYWRFASPIFGWNPEFIPLHTWDWPVLPVADERARATARNIDLQNGSTTLSAVYSEIGHDFMGEELPRMAEDYGVTVEEMQTILLQKNFGNLQVTRQGGLDNEQQQTTPEETADAQQ